MGFTYGESAEWVGVATRTTLMEWNGSRFEETGLSVGKGWGTSLMDMSWARGYGGYGANATYIQYGVADVRTSIKYYSIGKDAWRIAMEDYSWSVGLGLAWLNNYTRLSYYGALGWSNKTAMQQYFSMEGTGSMTHGAVAWGVNYTKEWMLKLSRYQGMYRVNATEAFGLWPLYVPWAPNVTAPPGAPPALPPPPTPFPPPPGPPGPANRTVCPYAPLPGVPVPRMAPVPGAPPSAYYPGAFMGNATYVPPTGLPFPLNPLNIPFPG